MIKIETQTPKSLKELYQSAHPETIKKALQFAGIEGVKAVKANFTDQSAPDGTVWKPSLRAQMVGGNTLQKKNDLYRSIDFAVLSDNSVVIFVNPMKFPEVKKYAAIHNFGGVIRPKTAKALTIPINKISMGKTVADMKTKYQALFTAKSQSGKLIIFGTNGGKTKPVPLFVLLKSVTIPKREFMGIKKSRMEVIQTGVYKILKGE